MSAATETERVDAPAPRKRSSPRKEPNVFQRFGRSWADYLYILPALAVMLLVIGYPITLRNGALWGACGWLAVHMLPAIGLPPELPGFPAAELGDRQTWWLATVALSAVGLYLVVLREEIVAKVVGLALIAAPHVYGAPQPLDISSNVPAVLGAEFAVAALATTLAFWIVLGVVSGFINERFARAN